MNMQRSLSQWNKCIFFPHIENDFTIEHATRYLSYYVMCGIDTAGHGEKIVHFIQKAYWGLKGKKAKS